MATDVKVEAQFSYSYFEADGSEISIDEGEKFILLKKSTDEWWKVERLGTLVNSKKKVIFVPATYVKEVTDNDSQVTSRNSVSGSDPEYMNLDIFRETMMRNNSATDSEYSYSDQETGSSLGTSPRMMNGSFSPLGMPALNSRKSLNLEAIMGGMAAKQAVRSDSIQSSGNGEEISEEDSSESLPNSDNTQVKYRNKRNVGKPLEKRSSTLPSGWQKVTDDQSGRQYYYNEVTKESVWKPPRISVFMDNNKQNKDVPAGWFVEKDQSNEDIYINSSNQEKWKACKTESGQTYYYKIGGDETVWELPEVEIRFRGSRRRSLDDLTDDKLGRMSSTFPRNSKCKSVLFDFSSPGLKKQKEIDIESPKTKPKILHRRSQSASTLLDSNDSETPSIRLPISNGRSKVPEVEGYLTRKKLVEAGKSKKFHWEQVYVCKYDNIMVFYKDKKSATPKPDFPDGKPESSIDLRGALLEPPNSEKTKGKKNVFQISTYNYGTVMMLMAETPTAMASWLTPIHSTIKKLEENNPLPTLKIIGRADSGAKDSENISNSLSPISKTAPPISPTTPTFARKDKVDRAERTFKGISRRLSKRGSTLTDEDSNKTKIKDKLRKFLPKRPTYYELEKKGIIKQEVFGCDLQKLCKREDAMIPKFVISCIDTVEKRGLKVKGIYRECGNASQMHKLRILMDQGERVDFNDKQWADVHVIAGALKWYLRELPDPLIPTCQYADFINAIKNPSVHERRRIFATLISGMPAVNQNTLKRLLQHLLKVTEYSSENKMERQNCSIVFGPTLMRPEDESDHLNIALNTVYQNQIVNFLLTEYSQLYSPQ